MSDEMSEHATTSDNTSSFLKVLTEKPVIKVLLYTDHPGVTEDEDPDFSLGKMKKHLLAHQPVAAKIEVLFRNRNPLTSDVRLDTLLTNEKPDEIWFFGLSQLNQEDVTKDYPFFEVLPLAFDKSEKKALVDWMNEGGVLITGDHANMDLRPHPPAAGPTARPAS